MLFMRLWTAGLRKEELIPQVKLEESKGNPQSRCTHLPRQRPNAQRKRQNHRRLLPKEERTWTTSCRKLQGTEAPLSQPGVVSRSGGKRSDLPSPYNRRTASGKLPVYANLSSAGEKQKKKRENKTEDRNQPRQMDLFEEKFLDREIRAEYHLIGGV